MLAKLGIFLIVVAVVKLIIAAIIYFIQRKEE